jgi:hypothetical protein
MATKMNKSTIVKNASKPAKEKTSAPKVSRARKSDATQSDATQADATHAHEPTQADGTQPQAMHVQYEAVAVRAFERFCARGFQHGHDVEDWLAAESELRQQM